MTFPADLLGLLTFSRFFHLFRFIDVRLRLDGIFRVRVAFGAVGHTELIVHFYHSLVLAVAVAADWQAPTGNHRIVGLRRRRDSDEPT